MVIYECKLCFYKTKLKYQLARHKNSNKHKRNELNEEECSDKIILTNSFNEPQMSQNEPQMSQEENNLENNYQCEFCGNDFSTHANKRKHEIHRCKERMGYEMLYNKEKKLWEKDKNKLYKHIDALIKKAGNTTNTIQLNGYGNEDLSHITDNFKTQLIKGPYGMIPKMIEAVHFNNKNICYPNKKEKMVKVYKDGEWKYYNKDNLIDELIENNYYILDIHYDESNDIILNDVQKKRYRAFKDKYNNGELDKDTKENINLLLVNDSIA